MKDEKELQHYESFDFEVLVDTPKLTTKKSQEEYIDKLYKLTIAFENEVEKLIKKYEPSFSKLGAVVVKSTDLDGFNDLMDGMNEAKAEKAKA